MSPDRLRHSLVVRTSLAVLTAALVVGLLFLGLAGRVARDWETRRQREALDLLLEVVAPSASAAAFADDRVLAEQVVQGMIATPLVHGATLRSRGEALAEAGRGPLAESGPAPVSRALNSPFAPDQVIGELRLVPDPAAIQFQVARTTTLARLLLAGLIAVLTLVLALAVHAFILRPITALSDRLHSLDPDAGGRLRMPAGHDGDEIGRLVGDINGLIVRMVNAIWKEQEAARLLAGDRPQPAPVGTGIFVARADGALEAWTPEFLRMLGLETTPPAAGSRLPGLFGGHAQELEGALAHCLGAGLPVQGTLRVLEPAGAGHRWLQYSLEPLGAGWCQGLLDDVSASTTTPVAAGLPATSDRLTGALNRLGAEYALAERFAAGARGIGILLADLDRFEGVNREFGRQAGDAVLLRATLRLAAALRRSDSVARLADDTFVVILDRLEDPEAGLRIADKLRAALAQPFPLEAGGEVRITVSIGLTLRRVGEEPSRSALLGRADQALRAAKAAGGNCGRLV